MQGTAPKLVEISDPDLITSIVSSLGEGNYALSARLDDGSAHDYAVDVIAVDPTRNRLVLEISAADRLLEAIAAHSGLELHARRLSETLRFGRVGCLDHRPRGDRLELECEIPPRLFVTSKRSAYRIPLVSTMRVPVSVTVFEGTAPSHGLLRNISIGGCLVQLPVSAAIGLKCEDRLTQVRVKFPNGETFMTAAQVRHTRIEARTHHALVGVQFIGLNKAFHQHLWYIIREIEREVAIRKGKSGQMVTPSALFKANEATLSARHGQTASAPEDNTPMVPELKRVAHRLSAQVIALQNDDRVDPDDIVACAARLHALLQEDRQTFFYALCCLNDQSRLIRHSLGVAGKLADMVATEPQYEARSEQIVAAALIHDLGKPLLLSDELKSLDGAMSAPEKALLRAHVQLIRDHVMPSWLDEDVAGAILGEINERLDGSGYPNGLKGEQLSPLARMAMVVDVLDALMKPRGDRHAWTAIEAYRHVHNHPELFDAQWLNRYIKRHGFMPIGSLVEFSRGFLAWVMALDENGRPSKVRVVRSMARRELNMNQIITRADFYQLGDVTHQVKAERYDLAPF